MTLYLGEDKIPSVKTKLEGNEEILFFKITDVEESGVVKLKRVPIYTQGSFENIEEIGESVLRDNYKNTSGVVTGYLQFSSLTNVGNYGLYYTFNNCTGITSVSFPELTSVGNYGLYYTFFNCSNITGALEFPKLTTLGSYAFSNAFAGCSGITSVSFLELVDLTSNCFESAFSSSGITSVSFPKLKTIAYQSFSSIFQRCSNITGKLEFPELISMENRACRNAFAYCSKITEISFPKLESIGAVGMEYCFTNCTKLEGDIFFPSLTTIDTGGLRSCFSGCRDITEVHFKQSLQGNTECTIANMGCPNATVYFDLP